MQAFSAYIAYMGNNQYTVRSVPDEIDRALRKKATELGKSLNSVLLETLERGLELGKAPVVHHDLDFMIGTWVEDPEFDAAIKEFRKVDEEMWK